ncbi:phage major capsid protein [Bacillus cereus]|uniref:phage major capsid protein n=1 Tax=Bacillus cereus group TaxID=86661 RepID=UPI00080F5A0E|nr:MULTISPECIES: phage major capsid protein [Bacillus cereus group]ANV71934.1 capsid protein [Bacillus thuringiensis]MCU7753535.1 phage major capsid protein [Bacillus cereus]MDC7750014.1 phage major capsid protein [Bacillus cereus]MDZ4552739.1 phage major capsid protein [Bacillus cereus]UXP16762.1 phage major capsid protein [Bacillus cereus]
MVIKFNKSEAFNKAKAKLTDALTNAESTEQEQTAAFESFFDAMQTDVISTVRNQLNDEMLDRSILQQRGQNVLTAAETKFFNEVVQEGGFKDGSILPVTTQERVFEDLVKEHPLLDALGLQDLGAVTKFIYSDATKAYAWGELFGEIRGQVNAAFREEKIGQLKLTAFAAIPNDMLDLGPEWVERYVRTLLVESYSVGLEFGFVNGGGSVAHQPVGLMKDVNATTGAVTDKKSSGTLTFAPSQFGEVVAGELYEVVKALSTDAKGKSRKVLNKIVMVVNPVDSIGVQARNTIQTSTGQWVIALPYNIQTVESEEVPVGKALFFVKGQYLAAIAGGYKLKKFDQTLAIEDAMLYTIKQFANGKPKDNKAALVYDLKISFTPPTPPATK